MHQCPNCCSRSSCRGKTSPVLGNLGNLGGRTKGHKDPQTGLYPSLRDTTQLDKVTNHRKLLCKSPPEPLPDGGIASAYEQKCSGVVQNQESLGYYKQLFLVPKPNNQWRPIPDLGNLNKFLNEEKFKMETLETIRTSLQIGDCVTMSP